jgi:hypothetical protein
VLRNTEIDRQRQQHQLARRDRRSEVKEEIMGGIPNTLAYLLMIWGAITAVLVVLVIYANALSTREDDEIYLNKTEESMMADEQRTLIGKMTRLARVITVSAIMSCVFLLASAGVWVWIGLYKS